MGMGRGGAFEAIYASEFAWVLRTVRRLGASAADAPDLVHDVFVAVYRRLGSSRKSPCLPSEI